LWIFSLIGARCNFPPNVSMNRWFCKSGILVRERGTK
jgi:hypothetical protein